MKSRSPTPLPTCCWRWCSNYFLPCRYGKMELSPLAAAIGGGIILRICWQDGSEHRRYGRDEILSVRVHAIHVRVDIEHDQPDSTCLQCHKPNYYHCCTCPHCIFYSSDLWLYQDRKIVV